MELKPGMKFKRKFGDQQVVTIKKIFEEDNEILITDSNGAHFIRTHQIDTHFDPINSKEEKDDIVKAYPYGNVDNPNKHNIANGMNQPSTMQKYAHFNEEK